MIETEMLLEMKGVSKSFSGVPALKQINFSVREGEVHALIGENGAGKSTLIKILSGAYTCDTGEIFLGGKVVRVTHPLDAQRLGISVIYTRTQPGAPVERHGEPVLRPLARKT
jgi:ABC-type sugar transport system ATPase subunit